MSEVSFPPVSEGVNCTSLASYLSSHFIKCQGCKVYFRLNQWKNHVPGSTECSAISLKLFVYRHKFYNHFTDYKYNAGKEQSVAITNHFVPVEASISITESRV